MLTANPAMVFSSVFFSDQLSSYGHNSLYCNVCCGCRFFYYFLYEQSALVFVIISIIIPADNDYCERKILYYTQFYFCYSSAICIISIAFCTRIFVANVIYCHTVILPAIANLNRHKHRIPKGLKYHIVICIIVH